jgi:HK97 gp10 family phage protein
MIEVLGVREAIAAFARIGAKVEAADEPAVTSAAQAVAREMNARAPRDTGALVAGISVDTDEETGEAVALIGSDVPYDRYVQRGTRYMAAQPYGLQAAAAAAPEVVARMAAVFKLATR